MIENKSIFSAAGKIAGHSANQVFDRTDEILTDHNMSRAEKRALLASWASDARAVPGAPSLRQLDDGSQIDVDTILRALKALDKEPHIQSLRPRPTARWLKRGESGRRHKLRAWLRPMRRRSRDDDDDPPPCPAYAAIAPRQGGGDAVAYPEPVPA